MNCRVLFKLFVVEYHIIWIRDGHRVNPDTGFRRLHNTHNGFQVVHVESRHGKTVFLTDIQDLFQTPNYGIFP